MIASSSFGKQKTPFQLVGICFLIIHFPYPLLGTRIEIDFHMVGIYVLFVSLALSIFSAVHYFLFFLEAAEKKRQAMEAEPKPPAPTDSD